jgi:hypothetical protein
MPVNSHCDVWAATGRGRQRHVHDVVREPVDASEYRRRDLGQTVLARILRGRAIPRDAPEEGHAERLLERCPAVAQSPHNKHVVDRDDVVERSLPERQDARVFLVWAGARVPARLHLASPHAHHLVSPLSRQEPLGRSRKPHTPSFEVFGGHALG